MSTLHAALAELADQWRAATCITDGAPCSFHRHADGYAADLLAVLAAHPAPEGEDFGPGCDCTDLCEMGPTCPGGMLAGLPGSGCHRSEAGEVRLSEVGDDGPECETCGKTTCPDAGQAAFSEPVNCEYAPIYRAFRDTKECDYGCGRDFTNQGIRLWIVPEVEAMIAARLAQPAGETRVEWGVRYGDGDVEEFSSRESVDRQLVYLRRCIASNEVEAGDYEPMTVVSRTVTSFPDVVGEWTEVD